jgi:hypothetical protein
MTDSNTQPHTNCNPRYYEGYKFEKENFTEPGKFVESYRVKVWDTSKIQEIPPTSDLSRSLYEEDYKTPTCPTIEKAFADAYRWVDSRIHHNENNPNETENF